MHDSQLMIMGKAMPTNAEMYYGDGEKEKWLFKNDKFENPEMLLV